MMLKQFHPGSTVIYPPLNLLRSIRETAKYAVWSLSRDKKLSTKNLVKSANHYSNKKAVILCNGPSLLKSNLKLLENTFTFGLNKINLLFDNSDFRPSAIVAVNPYVIDQNRDFYKTTDIPLFLDQKAARSVGIHANSSRTLLFSSSGFPGFSTNSIYSVNQGATVTYVALQLAYFFGFTKVALIGCDHNFQTKGPDHKLVKAEKEDANHFDPRYFSAGMPWQLPSITESEESYMKAKRFYSMHHRQIFNCTSGGFLELYPRITLEDFLET